MNYEMFFLLLIAAWAVSFGLGLISHIVLHRVLRGHRRTLTICIPVILLFLNGLVLFEVPMHLFEYFESSYGRDEPLGPIGFPPEFLIVLINWAFFVPLLFGYLLYLLSLAFRWLLGLELKTDY
jgi:hypothetical protein